MILDVPLARIGGKGLFVKEIEQALLTGSIDLAVHSMKDMPADIPEGLCVGAIPERETPEDVLISRTGAPLSALGPGSRIGTSSLRRVSQLRHMRPDITITPLRGNIDTRIKKLETKYSGEVGLFTFPILLDEENKTADDYHVWTIPKTVFIDSDGIIREIKIGRFNDEEEIKDILQSLDAL